MTRWLGKLQLLIMVYLLLFIIVTSLLLNADCVWPATPASWLSNLSGTRIGTEEGEVAQKKNG